MGKPAQSSGQTKKDRRGTNPNSLANLKRGRHWKPGESGNPGGMSLKQAVMRVLEQPFDKPTGQEKALHLLALSIVRDALKGSKEDRKEIWDRLDGKVTQPISGDDGGPMQVRIVVTSEKCQGLVQDIVRGKGTE
jgi:hypothetical protein